MTVFTSQSKQGWSLKACATLYRYGFGIQMISRGYDFISNYMNRYTFSAFPLYELGGCQKYPYHKKYFVTPPPPPLPGMNEIILNFIEIHL